MKFAAEEIVGALTGAVAAKAINYIYKAAKAKGASKATLEIIEGYCFVEGTEVVTKEGEKPIEKIRAGDEVLASDPECGEVGYRRVVNTIERIAPAVVDICIEGVIITCTPEHPFWVVGEGWIEAERLKAGSRLLTKGGEIVRVGTIERREGQFKVYNFEVERLHTYFVSKLGVLAHNSCRISPVADDWVTKGAHIKVDGVELAVKPGVDGKIVFKSVFSSADPKSVTTAIRQAEDALQNDPNFRQALLRSARGAVEYLKQGSDLARARSGELRFLVKALEKLGK